MNKIEKEFDEIVKKYKDRHYGFPENAEFIHVNRKDIIFNGEESAGNKESSNHVYIFNVKKGGEGKDIFPAAPKELIERAKKLADKYEIHVIATLE